MHHTDKVRLAEMTRAELLALLPSGPVILLPVGSHEDHGPQSPMGDFMCADKIAELIARGATHAGTPTLVAPVLPFGGANFFGSTPGGIALSQGTIRAVLSDILEDLLRHGLKRLIFINGHNGNVEPIRDVTQAIYRRDGIIIPSFYLWAASDPLLRGHLGDEIARRAYGHGADPMTSINMHLFPDCVRPDLTEVTPEPGEVLGLKVSGFGTVRFGAVDMHVPIEMNEIGPNGVWAADPSLASPETGRALAEALTDHGVRFVRHYAARTPWPTAG